VLIGSITRLRDIKLKEALNEIFQHIWAKDDFKEAITHMSHLIINLIQVQEGLNSSTTRV
jgi:hypothetical protein